MNEALAGFQLNRRQGNLSPAGRRAETLPPERLLSRQNCEVQLVFACLGVTHHASRGLASFLAQGRLMRARPCKPLKAAPKVYSNFE